MKRKIGFGIIVFLINLGLGIVSFRIYQDVIGRIYDVEINQKIYLEASQRMYDAGLKKLELDHDKTVAQLLKILGIDDQYDFNNTLIKANDLKKFFDHKNYLKASLRLGIPGEIKELRRYFSKGIIEYSEVPAIVIGLYILSASHTNDSEILKKQKLKIPTPSEIVEIRLELEVLDYRVAILKTDGSVHKLKELYRNREKDFTLFKGPENMKLTNFPFEIGKSNELRIGHFIYLNGQPAIKSEIARPGYVTSLVSASKSKLGVKKNDNEFGLSQSIDEGDSGSPVIAFRDGKPELIGIHIGWVGNDDDNGRNIRSRALKIDMAVDEIKERLGIDLRKLQHQILLGN